MGTSPRTSNAGTASKIRRAIGVPDDVLESAWQTAHARIDHSSITCHQNPALPGSDPYDKSRLAWSDARAPSHSAPGPPRLRATQRHRVASRMDAPETQPSSAK